jgi:hypothetical protein
VACFYSVALFTSLGRMTRPESAINTAAYLTSLAGIVASVEFAEDIYIYSEDLLRDEL